MQKQTPKPIDRKALVERHNINWNDAEGVLPVGNGEFAFGADITGLQTFAGFSMSHWGWHSFPLPHGITPEDIPATGTFMQGENKIPEEISDDRPQVAKWMFDNPHRMKLGRVLFRKAGGQDLLPNDLSENHRTLEIWTGIHRSDFTFEGESVSVVTVTHPDKDLVSFSIKSEALKNRKLEVVVLFEYPTLNDIHGKDFVEEKDGQHQTVIMEASNHQLKLERIVDDSHYYVRLWGEEDTTFKAQREHVFLVDPMGSPSLSFFCEFSPQEIEDTSFSHEEVSKASVEGWESFWMNGGAIDLSQSKDARWKELERRIVLSQYHMRAQSSGSWPSAEIGLMGMDNWRGQFHMEMAWWHLAHYGLWGRWDMAEQALNCYQTFLPNSKALAQQLGYRGAMWPKSVGPEGRSATWGGNTALLWKQPHPIFFAELEYRIRPNDATLKKWAEIVEETAEHMASYPIWDDERKVASLIPCILPSETGKTRDGIFDLVYWRWGLEKAQEWRERQSLPRKDNWDQINRQLAPLPLENGIYVRTDEPGTRHNSKFHSHPDSIGIYGMLPLTEGVDPNICKDTVQEVWRTWKWDRCWGWDFPWIAMAAARTGQKQLAIDILLAEAGYRNAYDETGLNRGGSYYYLPGNGGLLYVVAMMAAGWDNGEDDLHAPGFPDDGSWTVQHEGLSKAL